MTTQQLRFEVAIPSPQARPHRDVPKVGGVLVLMALAVLAWHFPKFTVIPAALDYGNTRVGGRSTLRPLMLTNRTSVNVHPTIRILGEATSDFVYDRRSCAGINAGETCELPIEFRPRAPGARLAHLMIDFSTSESTAVELTGTGIKTALQIRPSDLDFGPIPLGQSSDVKPVTIEGDWFQVHAVSVEGPAAGEFKVNAAACIQNTNEPRRCEITVRFQPHTTGLHEAVIKVDNGAGDSHAVLLHGTGAFSPPKSSSSPKLPQVNHTPILKPPSIRIDPMVLDFSLQPRRPQQVYIWNDGQELLQIERVKVLEGGCDRFAIQGNACTALPAGASCLITLEFNSRNLGNIPNCNAALQVDHDAQNVVTPQSIALQWSKANKPRLHATVIPDSLNFFGLLAQNRFTDIPPQMVTIRNDGQVEFTNLSLQLRTLEGAGVAHFQQTSSCRHLQVNEECQVQVSFSGSTTGTYTAKLYVLESMVDTVAVVQVNAIIKAPLTSGTATSQQLSVQDNPKTRRVSNSRKPDVSNSSKALGVFTPKAGVANIPKRNEVLIQQKLHPSATKPQTRKAKPPPADPIVR